MFFIIIHLLLLIKRDFDLVEVELARVNLKGCCFMSSILNTTAPKEKLISWQLNEVNFKYLRRYVELGQLPHFKLLFERYGYSRTHSEVRHELANPWIQWPTVHTGLDYESHCVFRTGDIVKTDHLHIYELLERHGLSVAAMMPFNAKNNTHHPAFFVPDPWTQTRFDGSWSLRLLYDALVEVAGDYAKGRISAKSLGRLAVNMTAARPSTLPRYVYEALMYFRGKQWFRALLCDRLLADVFTTQWQRHQPDYATLFMNGAAHLQHHYLFTSAAYDGDQKNPEWHISPEADPLLDIFKVYDAILARFLALGDGVRLMLLTGLHQEPHERTTYYYRLNDIPDFLQRLGISHLNSHPLMTEDFVVGFADAAAAKRAEQQLLQVKTISEPEIFYRETGDCAVRTLQTAPEVFHVENRGSDLYVQLKPTCQAVYEGMTVRSGERLVNHFDTLVSFAQYKNTHHVGIGYFLDTGVAKGTWPEDIPLREVFGMVLGAFGLEAGVTERGAVA